MECPQPVAWPLNLSHCSLFGRRRYFPYEIANFPRKVSNRTAMKIYIELLVNEMVSYGIWKATPTPTWSRTPPIGKHS
eukprot:SAG11_NODE_10118_length_853_cov_1.956233_1_plen_78_part_00